MLDTTAARYVWESPKYPQYYVPLEDVDEDVLVDEGHARHRQHGNARRIGLRAGGQERPNAGWVYDSGELAGTVRLLWAAVDAWFEEDEQVFVHPRSPYTRVDALRSTRRVRVELEGVVLAESAATVMVFETGLPTRYYFDRTSVDYAHLVPTDTVTACPYKGVTSAYWSAARRRRAASRPRLGLRLPHAAAAAHRRPRRLLQRGGRPEHRRRAPGAAGHALLPFAARSVARACPRGRRRERPMSAAPRRIVTGHDASGKSVVLSDAADAEDARHRDRRLPRDLDHRRRRRLAIAATEPEPTDRPVRTPPPADGVTVRFTEMAPGAESPMHRTETVDVGVVLEGETWLLLDDGSETRVGVGDAVVQRGTNHAWANRSDRPVRMLFVLIDGTITDELRAAAGPLEFFDQVLD